MTVLRSCCCCCWARSAVFRLTVGALLPPSSPLTAAFCPAVYTATLHRALSAGFGEAAQWGIVVSIVVHGSAGDRGAEPPHAGVSGQQGGGARGAHPDHGAAQDVTDAMRRPWLQLAVQARAELVEGVGHWVLAHWCLDVWGELVEAVVKQERPLDVWIHGKSGNSSSRSYQHIQWDPSRKRYLVAKERALSPADEVGVWYHTLRLQIVKQLGTRAAKSLIFVKVATTSEK